MFYFVESDVFAILSSRFRVGVDSFGLDGDCNGAKENDGFSDLIDEGDIEAVHYIQGRINNSDSEE